MKNSTKLMISAALLAPVFIVGSIGAVVQDDESTPEADQIRTTTVQEDQAARKAKLQERLDRRKAERGLRLTWAEQQKIKSVCKPSQGKLQALQGRIKGLETSRTERHANLLSRLERVSAKLQENSIDTQQLNAQIDELKAKIAAFETTLAEYNLVVSDLGEMDCVDSPVSFKASLETARIARQQAKQASDEVRAYLQQTLKPTLLHIRQQLSGGNAGGSTQESTQPPAPESSVEEGDQ